MILEIVKYRSEFQGPVVDLWRKCSLIVPQNDSVVDIRKKIDYQPELFFVALLNGRVIGSVMAGYEGHRGWLNYLLFFPNIRVKDMAES